ncbi:MAG: hypothetical protein ACMUEM_05615 [Flavobacteriales bacterium AspAUS03]
MNELKTFLEEKVLQYNQPDFIESDPIQILHLFFKKKRTSKPSVFEGIYRLGKCETILRNARW